MAESGLQAHLTRARIGWWLFVVVLGVAAAFIAYSFVGILSLGVFGYYATRPINRRLERLTDSDSVAAWATVLLIVLPLLLLIFYAGFQMFQQVQQAVGATGGSLPFENVLGMLTPEQRSTLTSFVQSPRRLVNNPRAAVQTVLQSGLRVISAVFGALLLVSLALALAYFLLENDDELATGLRELVGGRDTTAYAYASAVDEDLESVFFGNFLFVVVMSVVAIATYWATNALAPQGLNVPMIFVLGFLTGVASLIPIVVGKVVYVPVLGLLAVQASRSGGGSFVFVGAALVAYFLVLDILPQTFLQPYITGRQLDMMLMLFAYLLGPVLFGWYGFFLLPIVFIVMLETVRIVLPELVHGDAMTPDVEMGDSVGTDPREERDDVPERFDDVPHDDVADQDVPDANDDVPDRDPSGGDA